MRWTLLLDAPRPGFENMALDAALLDQACEAAPPLAAFGGLRQAYGAIHGLLASALRSLGAHPVLAARHSLTPGVAAGPCFSAPVGGEVLVDGRKVIGSAQLRQGDAF